MFVGGEYAKKLAEEELMRTLIQKDRLFAPLSAASIGTPFLVRNVFKKPSYWLIPLLMHDRVGGFVRVLGNGRVAHIGTFYHDPSELRDAPLEITGVSAAEASRQATRKIHHDQGESASDPIFVHDGPIGREAWLIEVVREGIPRRWIFVTPAFIYERTAGEMLDETME
ncbi:MAG: hypothetical protein JW999_06360 [Methanotrichaceae archaeon]|nr:hypothetical protein [Methanotrichaceae archaeon]